MRAPVATQREQRINVALAKLLDEEFSESLAIYPGDSSYPGPDVVWFDVDPENPHGWLVIRWLQEFVACGVGDLEPYTYPEGRPGRYGLGWKLRIEPDRVPMLRGFFAARTAREGEKRVHVNEARSAALRVDGTNSDLPF